MALPVVNKSEIKINTNPVNSMQTSENLVENIDTVEGMLNVDSAPGWKD